MDTKFLLNFTDEGTWEITCENGCVIYDGGTVARYQFDLTWFNLNVDGHICGLPELFEGKILPSESI